MARAFRAHAGPTPGTELPFAGIQRCGNASEMAQQRPRGGRTHASQGPQHVLLLLSRTGCPLLRPQEHLVAQAMLRMARPDRQRCRRIPRIGSAKDRHALQ